MTTAPAHRSLETDRTLGISLVRAIVHEFGRTGRDPMGLLDAVGIDRRILDDPYARLDVHRYRALQRLALERSEDPAFGLTMGEHASLASFGLVGHMVMHCRTLRDGLDLCVRYYKLVADADAPRLDQKGDRAELVYEFLRSSDPLCNRMRAEFGLTRLVLTARALVGPGVGIDEATFEHPQPDYVEHYRNIFGDVVRFESERTSLTFPMSLLDAPLVHHDESILRVLRLQADQMLAELENKEGLAVKIRRAVVSTFPDEPATPERLARTLGMTGRSLRRRLHQEGHTFQEVVADAMRDIACTMLRNPSTTIQETAYRLGFSESSAFHRAFKRWTGMTPAEWRRSRPE